MELLETLFNVSAMLVLIVVASWATSLLILWTEGLRSAIRWRDYEEGLILSSFIVLGLIVLVWSIMFIYVLADVTYYGDSIWNR